MVIKTDVIVKGYESLGRHDLKRAYTFFRKGLKNGSSGNKAYEALIGLSITYRGLGEMDRAMETVKLAMKRNPDGKEAYFNLGNIYEESGDHALAIQNYDSVISLDSSYLPAYINRGVALYRIENIKGAINDFKNVLDQDPLNPQALTNIGVCYLEDEKFETAIDYFDIALEEDPENIHALCGKGLALFQMDQYDESIICFDAALSIKGDFYIANFYKGHILNGLDLRKEAENAIMEALETREDYPLAWFELGEIHKSMRRIKEAISAYDKAIEYHNDVFEKAHFEKGKILLYEIRDYKGAIMSFRTICEKNPYISQVWYEMAVALSNIPGNDERSISALGNSIHLDPDNSSAVYLMASLLERTGDKKRALGILKQGMERNPSSMNSYLLSRILCEIGRYNDAIISAEDAISLDQNLSDAWIVMGRAYGKLGKNEEYKQCLRRYLNSNPDDAQISEELRNIG